MYLRHDWAGEPIFVPEDGPARDWVPTEPARKVDPPQRRHFINNLPSHKRATAMIRGYVETRVGCVDKEEASACRGFLKYWHEIEADGNPMGIGMAVMKAEGNAVQFFFNIHGIGPVVWLPVLVTAANEHTHHIMRESGPNRVSVAPEGKASSNPEGESRRGFPPKAKTVLIR